ncbi:glutathione transferase GST 23-like [Salvia miltiorrhiza]|uniref:glutathione transferase GST 23-like n=1 Tax=Salvia miltiorrhiza TaxID=226208 RepID=UPI0025AD3CFD|nr:glutathione transferase GST 23-like [Salvia miltiorrhiza]
MEETSNKVILFGTEASPFARRVIWALKLKGVDYDYVEEDLSNKSPALLHYNPIHKKVPVLVHAGKPVAESAVILEYIEETWPNRTPLLPKDPYERAVARFWIAYGDQKGHVFHGFLTCLEEGKEQAARDVLETFKIIQDEALGDKKFFGGNTLGLVDLCFGWLTSFEQVERVVGVRVLEPATLPRLHRWTRDFKEAPGIKENLPDMEAQLPELESLRKHLVSSKS